MLTEIHKQQLHELREWARKQSTAVEDRDGQLDKEGNSSPRSIDQSSGAERSVEEAGS